LNEVLSPHQEHNRLDYVFVFPEYNEEIGGMIFALDLIDNLIQNDFKVGVAFATELVISTDIKKLKDRNIIILKFGQLEYITNKIIIQVGIDNSERLLKLSLKNDIKIAFLLQGLDYFLREDTYESMEWLESKLKKYDYVLSLSPYLTKVAYFYGARNVIDLSPSVDRNLFYDDLRIKNKVVSFSLRNGVTKLSHALPPFVNHFKSLGFKTIGFGDSPSDDLPIFFDEYLGRIDRDQVAEVFRESMFFFDTSILEGVGLLAFEALYCGCYPFIYSRLGTESFDFVDRLELKTLDRPFDILELHEILLTRDKGISMEKRLNFINSQSRLLSWEKTLNDFRKMIK
jgi:hypothetical protein